MMLRPCTIIDAPSGLGLRQSGVEGLPEALRAAGLLEGLPEVRYGGSVTVPHYDPLPDPATGVLNLDSIRAYSQRLAERISFSLDLDRFPIVLGGDCSILLGAMLALRKRGRYGLLFIDGHADFYSPEAEPNGEVASMDLAIATGRGPAELVELAGRYPLVREEDVVLFSYRDAEAAVEHGSPDVRETSLKALDLQTVRQLGAVTAAREALLTLEGTGVEGFWIHLDADVLNDEVMPAVDYRMPDGLWPEELESALRLALSSPRVVGMDITIYNPSLDDAVRSAARTLAACVARACADGT